MLCASCCDPRACIDNDGPGADGVAPLTLAGKVARAHARMLLAVSWAPDASLFATGGRDNSVKLWAMTAAGDY